MLCATVESTGPGVFEAARRCRRVNWSSERVVVAGELSECGGRDVGGDGNGCTVPVATGEGAGNSGLLDAGGSRGGSEVDMGMTLKGC
jgi:hypothetical protein